MADIRITYDGHEAITTALLARRYGLTVDAARKALERLSIDPMPEPLDERTKLWPAEAVIEAMDKRPGRGANLRGHG